MKNPRHLYTFFLLIFTFFSCTSKGNGENESQHIQQEASNVNPVEINIEEKWELPDILKEVSGIVLISDNLFACVQDEDGKIFVYNTQTSQIEKEIPFAGTGDYEGIALVENTVYVVRSDGKIYQVENWDGEKPEVSEFDTHLTEDDNVEGLVYDDRDNQLLLAVKDGDKKDENSKGIYAFDLDSKSMTKEPKFKIDLNDPLLSDGKEKKKSKRFRPSEIGINPATGEIYLTDGPSSKLLIMDRTGKINSVVQLDEKNFPQAEGLTFNSTGEIFISNEGNDGTGNILKISLND